MRRRLFRLTVGLSAAVFPANVTAVSLLDCGGQCVPFARAAPGVDIYGNRKPAALTGTNPDDVGALIDAYVT